MNLRRSVFYILDRIRGGKVLRDIKEISSFVERGVDNEIQLKKLLKHATKTVDAYKGLMGFNQLTDFPVVNKNILRDNLQAHLSSDFDLNDLVSTTTSGSTGTPFKIYFDKRKLRRHKAALILLNEKLGAPIGQRLYYLRVWNNLNRKNKLSQLLENIIPVEVSHFDENTCNNFLKSIGGKKVAILGFASAITDLTRNAKYIPPNLTGIITMSEHLSSAIRHEAINKFGCQVNSRYSNMENGLIAQQNNNSDYYYINSADFKVEILHPDKDVPAGEGEIGRIVITDLYNYAMPFIRYDTGDMGVLSTLPDGRKVLSNIEGRKCDLISDTNGGHLSSHIITNSLWAFPEIKQYQFIQKGESTYLLRINLQGKKFERQIELENTFKKYLGENALIRFEYVDEIPVLNSGKRRYIINELEA